MPLDVAAGEPQELMNWLAGGGFFVTIGGVSGSTIRALLGSFEADLASQLCDEVGHATSGDDFEWEQIAQATLYGMDPYRSAMVGGGVSNTHHGDGGLACRCGGHLRTHTAEAQWATSTRGQRVR